MTPAFGDEPRARDLEGQRFGPYQLGARIGVGGMGEVYRASDTRLDRTVAVKVLSSHVAADPQSRERFEREARAVGALNHPHICTLHDVGHQRGIDFLVMEYLEGETLADRLGRARDRPLPLTETLRFAIQIASALDRAHRAGIFHRDIKPGNIMLTKTGVKLLDFGLAKAGAIAVVTASPDIPTRAELTAPGTILGTLQYMAPEQLEGKATDARTDIFAFGLVLYEMVAGRKAFEGSSHANLIAAILEHDPPPLSSVQPNASESLERVVRSCLAKDPDDRWQSARDLLRALEWESGPSQANGTARPKPRRVVLASAAVGLAIGALGMWAASSRLTPDTSIVPRLTRFTISLPSGTVISPTQNRQETISPDGTQIVYAGLREGQRMLYLRRVDELEARPLEGTAGASGPIFSPDGKSVGFTRPGGSLMQLALSGGAPVQITNNESGIQGASWGPDGTVVLIDLGLWSVPAAGGRPIELAKPDTARGERWFRSPVFLPGGRHILLTVATSDAASFDDAQIVLFDLDTRKKTILVEGGMSGRYSPSGHLVYARNGSLLAVPFDLDTLSVGGQPFPVASGVFMSINSGFAEFDIAGDGTLVYAAGTVEGGERTPVWVDRRGQPTPLPLPPRSYLHPRISPDGQHLAIEVEGPSHDLFTYDFARGTFTRLTFDGMSHWPLWAPHGDRLAFRSYRTNTFTMWSMPADRSGPEQPLTTTGRRQSAASWSPDGKAVSFSQVNADTGSDVYVLPLDGDGKAVPIAQSRFVEGSPKFSPDGRWIAYSSNESGRAEVYVQPWRGSGPKIQVSTDGGTDPVWSRGSGELFYRNGDKMMASAVRYGEKLTISAPHVLWEGHYAAGMSSSCGVPGPTSANYDVTADGQRFLMIQDKDQDAVARQLVVVTNWAASLKR
jgi:eukaryotic-like serine/threonine-protein kinase